MPDISLHASLAQSSMIVVAIAVVCGLTALSAIAAVEYLLSSADVFSQF